MKYWLTLLMLLSGCGVTVHSDPVKVDPIEVNHYVTVNTVQLEEFYKAYCTSLYATQDEIDQCVTQQLANFWLAVQQSTPPGAVQQTVTPNPNGGSN